MQRTFVALTVVMLFMATATDGFFFWTTNRRHDSRPAERRKVSIRPRPYWDPTWSRPYVDPSEARRHYYRLPSNYYYSSARDSYHAGGFYYRRRPLLSDSQRADHSSGRYPVRHPDAGPPTPRRVVDPYVPESSNSVPTRTLPPTAANSTATPPPEPAQNRTETERAHNYMKNAELVIKMATHLDTQGCFRRLVCECEYYGGHQGAGAVTMEEKLMLHVFGMKRRREVGDMDSARFLHAAALGEAARENGRPDPCATMSPKCPQNMVKKLRARASKRG